MDELWYDISFNEPVEQDALSEGCFSITFYYPSDDGDVEDLPVAKAHGDIIYSQDGNWGFDLAHMQHLGIDQANCASFLYSYCETFGQDLLSSYHEGFPILYISQIEQFIAGCPVTEKDVLEMVRDITGGSFSAIFYLYEGILPDVEVPNGYRVFSDGSTTCALHVQDKDLHFEESCPLVWRCPDSWNKREKPFLFALRSAIKKLGSDAVLPLLWLGSLFSAQKKDKEEGYGGHEEVL